MRRFSLVFLFAVLLAVSSAGCASDGGIVNPFSNSEPDTGPTTPYYFDEFSDIPIPNDMSESTSETVVTSNQSGLKYGTQYFKGRVELGSLVNSMRNNMNNQGWSLRSVFRAKETILVYEKPDRVCSIYITDGLLMTGMRIYVSQRLDGDSANLQIPVHQPVSADKSGHLTE